MVSASTKDSSSSTTRMLDPLLVGRLLAHQLVHREFEGESRALALARFDDDRAAVVLGDVAHDAEAEPGAAGLTGPAGIDAVEAFEDPLEVLGGYPDALVLDGDAHQRADDLAVSLVVGSIRSTVIVTSPPMGE